MALNINGTTGISGVDGSVSAPAVTGTDSNTGITFPSADTIKFSTGGVERMQITNSGVSGTGVGGKILQVVTGTTTTGHANTSTTYADTGLTATISISANSKVLVLVTQFCQLKRNSGSDRGALKLLRGSSDLLTTNGKFFGFNDAVNSNKNVSDVVNFMIVDTGASTGSNTYKTQSRVNIAADSAEFFTQDDSNPAHMTLIEIAA